MGRSFVETAALGAMYKLQVDWLACASSFKLHPVSCPRKCLFSLFLSIVAISISSFWFLPTCWLVFNKNKEGREGGIRAADEGRAVRGSGRMASPRSQESWDCMLPGPPSRSNGGSADYSPGGLVAYGAGSSVVVADPRSMQLVSVLPMPAPHNHNHHSSSSSSSVGGSTASSTTSPHALAPFVTSVRWCPQPLSRDLSALDDPSNSHLRLAVGDRQGRIALWDFRSRQVLLWLDLDSSADRSRLGIQDLCWVRSSSWLLASIHGASLLALWDVASGRCLWKYDATPEYLSCIRRDPFDSRHFCTLGLRGFLLSAVALGGGAGGGDGDVSIQEHQISGIGDLSELQKLEKEAIGASPSSPALALFPIFLARLCFSPLWRHILIITFPKELIVFDLQYGASLSATPLPRGCGKFLDLVPDPDLDLLYCAHLDGKLSIWKRKE